MRRHHQKWLALAMVILLAAIGLSLFLFTMPQEPANPGGEELVQDELPSSWSLREIAEETPPGGYGTGGVYILAWRTPEDDPSGLHGSCLVMRVLPRDDGYGRWSLAHLYRDSHHKDAKWRLSMTHVTGRPGTKYFPGLWLHHCKRFKERPTNKDLYAACEDIEGVNWHFESDKESVRIKGGVCERNWQKVIGEKPARFFKDRE